MSPRNKMILIGGLVGAVIGATAMWAHAKAQEGKLPAGQTSLRLHAGAPEYVKIALSVLSLVRQVVDLFKPV
ncbi:MAG: hypothetical protein FJ011_18770 [Chloroflexi bacterium]|nr:hypothetical protein [Chloroflexota bacterium]